MTFLFVLFFSVLIIGLMVLMRIDLIFHFLTENKEDEPETKPEDEKPPPPPA